jgi:integrase
MALFRRGKWWWTDFSVNGVRFRQPIRDEHGKRTKDWREAQAREKGLITEAMAGKLAPSSQKFARLAFSEAAKRYLESRKLELSPRSLKKETQLLVEPGRFLASTPLSRLCGERLLLYREVRAQKGASPAYINMEMGAIRRILKRAKCWDLVAGDIKPLKERHQVGRALSHEEKVRLLKMADSNPDWQNARLAQTLALNTAMRGCEIKGLRWKDVDLIDRSLKVGRATTKTDAGERVIPLNANAMAAIVELYRRSQAIGATEPNHHLFPACENDKVDPTRPQTTWRSAWRRLTRAIHCPACGQLQNPGKVCSNEKCKADIHEVKSPTAGLRFHDLRHHAITELAESQASDQTVMAIAGHVSPKMLAHYSHVRMDAKRKALDALSGGTNAGSYDTKHDTNALPAVIANPQVVEINGRPVGTRTPDLYRVKVAL